MKLPAPVFFLTLVSSLLKAQTTNYTIEATTCFENAVKDSVQQNSFDYENTFKLNYTGNEDEIIQKIEEGNVSLPLTKTENKNSASTLSENVVKELTSKTSAAVVVVVVRDAEGKPMKTGNNFAGITFCDNCLSQIVTGPPTALIVQIAQYGKQKSSVKRKINISDEPITNEVYDEEIMPADNWKKTERPITQKINISDEPLDNKVLGLDEAAPAKGNAPAGSVCLTAGGVVLSENVDYTVDYTTGRVIVINETILQSGIPIKVSLAGTGMINKNETRAKCVNKAENNQNKSGTEAKDHLAKTSATVSFLLVTPDGHSGAMGEPGTKKQPAVAK